LYSLMFQLCRFVAHRKRAMSIMWELRRWLDEERRLEPIIDRFLPGDACGVLRGIVHVTFRTDNREILVSD
jgi:hypothetical protein